MPLYLAARAETLLPMPSGAAPRGRHRRPLIYKGRRRTNHNRDRTAFGTVLALAGILAAADAAIVVYARSQAGSVTAGLQDVFATVFGLVGGAL